MRYTHSSNPYATFSLCVAMLAGTAGGAAVPAAEPARVPAPKSEKEQLSYALGIAYGNQLRRQAIELDPDAFNQGLSDGCSGAKTRLTQAEIRSLLAGLQEEQRKKHQSSRAEKARAARQIAEKNKADGEAFLAGNKAKEGIVALPSGLQYRILRAGDGKKPELNDRIICHYRGMRLDGTEFYSTTKSDCPATLPLAKLMPGWREALQLMPVGSKWRLFIPANLAYGLRGAGRTVPPNSTLIFEVDLLGIKGLPAARKDAMTDSTP